MSALTYNDTLSAYAPYPAPIRPYLLRAETHPTLRACLTKSFMRVVIDLLARAPIADPCRALKLRIDHVAETVEVSTKTVTRALNLLRKKGWIKRAPGTDGRNTWGEFCAGEFILGDELRAMLGLPTATALEPDNEPSLSAMALVAENTGCPALSTSKRPRHPSNEQTADQPVPSGQTIEKPRQQTKMSDGLYRVNKVFKKEASFEQDAFDAKTKKQPLPPPAPKIPADLQALQTELGIHPRGICKLMRLAKTAKQRIQDIWLVRRDQILAAGATEGRAVRYFEKLLTCGEDFAYVARQHARSIRPEVGPLTSGDAGSTRRHRGATFVGSGQLVITVTDDGAAFVTDATRRNVYVRPADTGPIFDAIAVGKLRRRDAENTPHLPPPTATGAGIRLH